MALGLNLRRLLAETSDRIPPVTQDLEEDARSGLARFREGLPGTEDRLREDLSAASARVAEEIEAAAAATRRALGRLPEIEDRLRPGVEAEFDGLGQAARDALAGLPALEDRIRVELGAAEGGTADDLAAALRAVEGLDLDNLNIGTLEELANRLPPSLSGPDATGEVPTGSADIGRADAALAARLSAVPRILESLGQAVVAVDVEGGRFAPVTRYADADSGFLAWRLTPAGGGREVFAVDGLQVGSRADAVASATLGQLQAESDAFAAMIADASALGLAGVELLFTGPSLGGAVAQAAAYEAAEGLAQSAEGFETGAVRLVTVDPLGGRDAAEGINGGTLDPAVLALIEALNIRNDGDLITRIGSHIGATLTLPTLDAEGNRVELNAAEAHVNAISLLQVLESDALFAEGVLGAPAEIAGFATLSELLGPAVARAWVEANGGAAEGPVPVQLPGRSTLDESRTVWQLDADRDGVTDVTTLLAAPLDPARAELVLVG